MGVQQSVARALAGDDARGGRVLVLRGDAHYVVEAGSADVFCVALVEDEPAGARRHLFRVEAGGPLFAVGPEEPAAHVLLAVGSHATRWRKLPADEVTPALREQWIGSLYGTLVASAAPADLIEVDAGSATVAEQPCALRPRGCLACMRVVEGEATLCGVPELALPRGASLPVASPAWVVAQEGARLQWLPAASGLQGEAGAAGLAHLHALVLVAARLRDADLAARQQERGRRKAESNSGHFREAMLRLASSFDRHCAEEPRLAAPAAPANAREALLAACRAVGRSLEVPVEAAHVREGAPPREVLAAIARASRLRVRRVALHGEWWRRDNGPLLAFREEGRQPVALIPRGFTRYALHDPAATDAAAVDAAVAATLTPVAYTFYRPFPARAVGARQLLRFGLKGCRSDIAFVLAMAAATTVLGLFTPVATGILFDAVIPGAQRGQLLQVAFILVAAAVAGALFQVTRSVALVRLETRLSASVQAAVWDRLLSLDLQFFRRYSAGDLAVRAMSLDSMRQVLSGAVIRGFLGLVVAASSFVLLFHYSLDLAWRAAVLMLVGLVFTVAVAYLQLRHQRQASALRARVSGLVLQLLTGVAKIRVAGAEMRAFARWATLFAEQRRAQLGMRSLVANYSVFEAVLGVVASLVIFAAVGTAAPGSVTVGEFVAFNTAFATCLVATLGAGASLISVLNVLPQYEMARPILRALPEVSEGRIDPGALSGGIRLDNVVFRYAAEGAPILDELSLHVRAGEFVALVGPSGTGKSTILRLLLGFDTPERGSVYYDEQDLQNLDIAAVRRQIGVVLQAGRLSPGDIYSQIVGSSSAHLDDAWEAARMAGLDEDIRQMPMGMHTVVSEGGSTLSGGQRQRLMIARAIVGRPRILLLDEATSALDNRTQAIVSESLARLRATRVVVAHRLSTIVSADRIYVIERGRIVQMGSYEELLRQDGLFAELVRRQVA